MLKQQGNKEIWKLVHYLFVIENWFSSMEPTRWTSFFQCCLDPAALCPSQQLCVIWDLPLYLAFGSNDWLVVVSACDPWVKMEDGLCRVVKCWRTWSSQQACQGTWAGMIRLLALCWGHLIFSEVLRDLLLKPFVKELFRDFEPYRMESTANTLSCMKWFDTTKVVSGRLQGWSGFSAKNLWVQNMLKTQTQKNYSFHWGGSLGPDLIFELTFHTRSHRATSKQN